MLGPQSYITLSYRESHMHFGLGPFHPSHLLSSLLLDHIWKSGIYSPPVPHLQLLLFSIFSSSELINSFPGDSPHPFPSLFRSRCVSVGSLHKPVCSGICTYVHVSYSVQEGLGLLGTIFSCFPLPDTYA